MTSGHIPALDGLRAFAVLAVIAFHTNLSSLPGSFYGVDTFFTLSGFLITSLLVAEWGKRGRISLGHFWARRARRLLPALFLMLIGVGVIAAVWPSVLGSPQLLGDAIATVFYTANWHLIAEHANYFNATQPSPLLHTWSLAIEEQFYVVWPLVVLAVMRGPFRRRRRAAASSDTAFAGASDPSVGAPANTRRRLWILLAISGGGAVASALWMAAITHQGSDTTRSYYGSDTRAQAILVGAALAVALALWRPVRAPQTGRTRLLLGAVGFLGVAVTSALWTHVAETSQLAFHGGFFLAALSTAAIIVCITEVPGSGVAALLSLRPLRYLGRISYGMYLWYLPLTFILSGPRTHIVGYPLFALRLVVTVAVASVSAYALELPIRRGTLRSWQAGLAVPTAAGAAVLTVFLAGVVPSTAAAAPDLGRLPRTAQHGPPVKVLVVGDSVAGSLGVGLSRVAHAYGAVVLNEGSPGCSVSMDQSFQALWSTVSPGTPCRYGVPTALLDQWRTWVGRWNPDVVVYVARGEVFNQEVNGRWEHLGDQGFDAYVTARFQSAVSVLGSRGAHVVLLTSPYYDSGVQVDGAGWPEDNPTRVAIDNRIIAKVAAGRATLASSSNAVPDVGGGVTGTGAVSSIPLGQWLSPAGHFATDVHGVDVRCTDGVHFTVAGGAFVARRLLPQIVPMGRVHQSVSPGGTWSTPLPSAPPPWFGGLPCASS